jgi:D-glycero-D-manno-heptose 1,7-bisphosphate phosphatase
MSAHLSSPIDRAKPAIFLDRDGTINREVNYLSDPNEFELLAGAAAAISEWNAAGWVVVIVTNQSGVARGYFSLETLGSIHALMRERLEQEGARIDGIYFCPHHPDDGCLCRKPATGLFETAAKELRLDLRRSYFIGDKLTDLLPAEKFDGRSVLVRTGHGSQFVDALPGHLRLRTEIANDLAEAAQMIKAKTHPQT